MPIAVARSRASVNTLDSRPSVAGKIRAAATPIAARPAISCPVVFADAAATEVSPNRTSPI